MTSPARGRRGPRNVRAFLRDRRGAEALEFALIAFPFLYTLLVILQMGVFYMTQAALDAGVNATANGLRNSFNTSAAAVLPTASALRSSINSNSGGFIATAGLAVDLRALSSLDAGAVAIADGTIDSVTTNVPIVLRAQSAVITVAPGFPLLITVQSSAVLRFGAF